MKLLWFPVVTAFLSQPVLAKLEIPRVDLVRQQLMPVVDKYIDPKIKEPDYEELLKELVLLHKKTFSNELQFFFTPKAYSSNAAAIAAIVLWSYTLSELSDELRGSIRRQIWQQIIHKQSGMDPDHLWTAVGYESHNAVKTLIHRQIDDQSLTTSILELAEKHIKSHLPAGAWLAISREGKTLAHGNIIHKGVHKSAEVVRKLVIRMEKFSAKGIEPSLTATIQAAYTLNLLNSFKVYRYKYAKLSNKLMHQMVNHGLHSGSAEQLYLQIKQLIENKQPELRLTKLANPAAKANFEIQYGICRQLVSIPIF